MTLTEAEARLVGAMLTGDCDYNLFTEGGDYASLWAERCGVADVEAFALKVATLATVPYLASTAY